MSKVSKDRSAIEKAEGLTTLKVDAPEERFQQDQQVNTTLDQVNDVKDQSFIPKKTKSSGHTLRQEVAAQVVKGKGGAGITGVSSPASYGLKEISFSGDTGTILGTASGTPSMEKDIQGKTRVDKRISDANKDINYNASEQVINEYDNIPPLAASESTVGYNGNPKNLAARSVKTNGLTSAELLYDRSLDFIAKDAAVFSVGQVVQQFGINSDCYPTMTVDLSDPDSDHYGENRLFKEIGSEEDIPVRGNFMPRNIKVTFKKDSLGAYVSSFAVEEDNISTNDEGDQVVNASCTNHKIDINRAELARQTIDADAGAPTAEHFNPLGRSIEQSTRYVTLLQDIENVTGAEIFAAYKFANKARGHFLNRTAKDGQFIEEPGIDALYGHLYGANNITELIDNFLEGTDHDAPMFSKKGNRAGSAAVLIYAFDSISKYKTKGDLVNQPRGLKMHIQTADNNMDPFRCKTEFVAALNSIDAYSTIDHAYDPMSPVYITDNIRLVHPYSWKSALGYTRDSNRVKHYTTVARAYKYSAGSGQNKYTIVLGEPVLNGVAYFLEQHAGSIFKALTDDKTGEATLTIPVVHSTMHFSLWDLLVCASTPYIIYERTNTMKDILDYEMFYKYPFQGNVRIADAQPTMAVNYANPSVTAALEVKQMLPSSALRWKYPELLIKNPAGFMLPFYFNERSYTFTETGKDSKIEWNGELNFTTPVVRSGMKLGGLDDFFSMTVMDNLLLHDPMVRIPCNSSGEEVPGFVYKYSADSDGIVGVLNSHFYGGVNSKAEEYYATPRLLGWYFDLPAGAGCAFGTVEGLRALSDMDAGAIRPSFRAIMYQGVSRGSKPTTILSPGSISINRGQSFRQTWHMARAGAPTDRSDDFDIILSVSEGFESAVENFIRTFISLDDKTQFMPFMYGDETIKNGVLKYSAGEVFNEGTNTKPAMFSIHRILWAILQKMNFIINPFDVVVSDGVWVDPFSLPYTLGLAGFMAANYDEEIFNRINEVQEQGYGYTHDPMTAKSPVFKDAYHYTKIG